MNLSIVIPVLNEEKNIMPLYTELNSILKGNYEIIFIDDGSTDKTMDVIESLCKKKPNVKAIKFKMNYKKAAALSAGFEAAKGNVIITLDGDLQDNPKEIPNLIKKLNSGYDMVVGWKKNRKDPIMRRINSKIFNFLIRRTMNINIHDSDCNFRAMKNEVAKKIHIYGGLYRYIPAIAKNMGYKIGEAVVSHRKRKFGKSKYGITRLYTGFFDLITVKFLLSYKKNPMHLFAFPGIIFSTFGFLIAGYLTFIRIFFKEPIGDRPLLLLAVLLLVLGIQFFSIGLLGEMLTSRDNDKKYIIEKRI